MLDRTHFHIFKSILSDALTVTHKIIFASVVFFMLLIHLSMLFTWSDLSARVDPIFLKEFSENYLCTSLCYFSPKA